MSFEPTAESVRTHQAPAWFHDAKFGIFIHWTMASVPAFAPQAGSLVDILREHPADFQKYNPYAEWYWNTMMIPGSETAAYHAQKYGAGAPFDIFRQPFEEAIEAWDPAPLAELIAASGAKYVVLVTKHHDGFALWPTAYANPHRPGWHTKRDLVGDIAAAVRARGLRFGVYYSGGLDWTFEPPPIVTFADLFAKVPASAEYRAYAANHYRELMQRYNPDVLWNDIAYPPGPELPGIFADFYNRNPDAVVNDRWAQPGTPEFPQPIHHDFRTPEYAQFPDIRAYKWEATRGIGHSFGYVANEDPANIITPVELVHSFVDAVSKNGNLLLNIGPKLDGSVDPAHEVPLRALGGWLRENGDAIFGTRPWVRAEGEATGAAGTALPVRFTTKGERLFAIVLGSPAAGPLRLNGTGPEEVAGIRLLDGSALSWRASGDGVEVDVPAMPATLACVFEVVR